MRNRLIESIKQGDKAFANKYTGKVMSHIEEVYDFIADHLLADGWVRPPCKVGQIVYQTQPIRNRVQAFEVTAYKFNGNYYHFSWTLKDHDGFYENVDGFSEFQIGATVFLSEEEALKALKGGGEK